MDTTNIEKKLDQLIDLSLRGIVLNLYKNGHTMDEICKNLHIHKTVVVKMLGGLNKTKKI